MQLATSPEKLTINQAAWESLLCYGTQTKHVNAEDWHEAFVTIYLVGKSLLFFWASYLLWEKTFQNKKK